jgi:hypothetical protein
VLSYDEKSNKHLMRYLEDGDESSEVLWKFPGQEDAIATGTATNSEVKDGVAHEIKPVKIERGVAEEGDGCSEAESNAMKKRNIDDVVTTRVNDRVGAGKMKLTAGAVSDGLILWYWLDEDKQDTVIKKKRRVESENERSEDTGTMTVQDSSSMAEVKEVRSEVRSEVSKPMNRTVYPGESLQQQDKVTINSSMSLAMCERLLSKIHGGVSSGTNAMRSGDMWDRVYDSCRSLYGVYVRKMNTSTMTIITNGHGVSTDETVPVWFAVCYFYCN